MPKSRTRKKAVYTPPPKKAKPKASPAWLVPVMLGTLLIGLVWIALYYVTGDKLPIESLNAWNLLIGFAFIIGGVGLSTRWR